MMEDDDVIIPDGDLYEDESQKLQTANFELYGNIRRRPFRAEITKKTNSLGIKGHCTIHSRDFVTGEIQGPPQQFEEMTYWFSSFESPEIEFTAFRTYDHHAIDDYSFENFKVHPYKPTK